MLKTAEINLNAKKLSPPAHPRKMERTDPKKWRASRVKGENRIEVTKLPLHPFGKREREEREERVLRGRGG